MLTLTGHSSITCTSLPSMHIQWPDIFEMNHTTASETISTLCQLFSQYGLPELIVSDNRPQLVSAEFADLMRMNRNHICCALYHPSSNGAVERFVRTFKQSMKAGEKGGLTSKHRLANFLLTYCTTHRWLHVTCFSAIAFELSLTWCNQTSANMCDQDRHFKNSSMILMTQTVCGWAETYG